MPEVFLPPPHRVRAQTQMGDPLAIAMVVRSARRSRPMRDHPASVTKVEYCSWSIAT
jgi:hypothetical protein